MQQPLTPFVYPDFIQESVRPWARTAPPRYPRWTKPRVDCWRDAAGGGFTGEVGWIHVGVCLPNAAPESKSTRTWTTSRPGAPRSCRSRTGFGLFPFTASR